MTGMAVVGIKRPKYAKDKRIVAGMRLFLEDGALVARKHAPAGGGRVIGVVATGMEMDEKDVELFKEVHVWQPE